MPVRGKNLTAMLLESIDDRPALSAVAKNHSDGFATELGAAISTGETDFGTPAPSRSASKDASASSKAAPASSSNRRTACAVAAKTSAQNTFAQAPLAPALVPVAANYSTPELSQTDSDSSDANAAAQEDPQTAAAMPTSVVTPDARPRAGAAIMTIARDCDITESSGIENSATESSLTVAAVESDAADRNQTASGKSAPDFSATSQAATASAQSAQTGKSAISSGVSLKIKSSPQSNSSRPTAQPNDAPAPEAGQASGQVIDQPMAQASRPALQKDQLGQPQPDATAGTNAASVTGAHSGSTQSQAGDTQAVTPTPVASVTPSSRTPETAIQRVANLKVDLNEAGSAHATIRERAGEVDVKIVTPDSESARNLGNEVHALRRSLDGAGLKLRNAEVVYRSDRYQNPQRDDSRQNSEQQSGAGSAETFTIEETNQ